MGRSGLVVMVVLPLMVERELVSGSPLVGEMQAEPVLLVLRAQELEEVELKSCAMIEFAVGLPGKGEYQRELCLRSQWIQRGYRKNDFWLWIGFCNSSD